MMLCSVNFACAIIVACLCFVDSESIYEALGKKPHLSEFYNMVGQGTVLVTLLDSRDVTLFAPTNAALKKAKSRKMDDPKRDVDPRIYVLNMFAPKSMFPFRKAPYLAGVAPLYLKIKEDENRPKEYFVNNAKIIGSEEYRGTEGKTQLLYIIDDVLEPYIPVSSQPPPTALQLLIQPSVYKLKEPLDAFAGRVTSETEKTFFSRVGQHTFFLPVGSADEMSSVKLQDIDQWIVRAHVISQHVLFLRTMSRKTYLSETWGEHLKVELKITNESPTEDDDKWYIQSNTILSDMKHRKGMVRAKIVRPNIPVSNGVVHLIDKPLMVIDKTLWEQIEEYKSERLSQFYNLAMSNLRFMSYLKTMGRPTTVFAPSDKAFRAIQNVEKYQQIFSNATATSNLLELHLIMESVATEDVWNKNVTKQLTSDNRRNLYFRVVGDERNKTLTVEGGGVNATAIMADIGATNGILHIIDRVLGMPYLTVYSKLAHDPDLHTTYKLGMQESWNQKLNDKEKRYTFFAPSRKAWEDLEREMPSEHKQLHLGQFSYHVHKILDRHLVVGNELTKEDLEKLGKVQMVHGMFRISPGYQSGSLKVEWEGLEAHIVRPDVKATNGIIHVIDRVMMKRRDLTKSGAGSWSPSIITFVLPAIFFLI
ncbi:fasciclin-1 [Parasteatoda tepidariorum]|nr:fasciclin-1 [Parasteatoda tepidariorum]